MGTRTRRIGQVRYRGTLESLSTELQHVGFPTNVQLQENSLGEKILRGYKYHVTLHGTPLSEDREWVGYEAWMTRTDNTAERQDYYEILEQTITKACQRHLTLVMPEPASTQGQTLGHEEEVGNRQNLGQATEEQERGSCDGQYLDPTAQQSGNLGKDWGATGATNEWMGTLSTGMGGSATENDTNWPQDHSMPPTMLGEPIPAMDNQADMLGQGSPSVSLTIGPDEGC